MTLIQEQKFRRKNLRLKSSILSINLTNEEDQDILLQCQYVLQQTKPSTAMKQLMRIGAKVILGTETGEFLRLVLGNIRRNERMNITDVKTDIDAKIRLKH